MDRPARHAVGIHALIQPQRRQPRQLQDRQEGGDDDQTRGAASVLLHEDLLELDGFPALERPHHGEHALAHGDGLDLDLVGRRLGAGGAQHPPVRLEEVEQPHLDLALGIGDPRRLLPDSREDLSPEQATSAQLAGRLLEALVLEQPRDQLGARIAPLIVVDVSFGGQQHARLDPRQRRRHQQVLAGDVEVELPHHVEVFEVLLGDLRDGDVGDLHLVQADQVQQEIEGPLEGREHHRIRRTAGAPRRFAYVGGNR